MIKNTYFNILIYFITISSTFVTSIIYFIWCIWQYNYWSDLHYRINTKAILAMLALAGIEIVYQLVFYATGSHIFWAFTCCPKLHRDLSRIQILRNNADDPEIPENDGTPIDRHFEYGCPCCWCEDYNILAHLNLVNYGNYFASLTNLGFFLWIKIGHDLEGDENTHLKFGYIALSMRLFPIIMFWVFMNLREENIRCCKIFWQNICCNWIIYCLFPCIKAMCKFCADVCILCCYNMCCCCVRTNNPIPPNPVIISNDSNAPTIQEKLIDISESKKNVDKKQEKKLVYDPKCVVCTIRDKNRIIKPCGHLCICSECANTINAGDNRCPICRITITSFEKCYLA